MADKREAILARLEAIVAVDGFTTTGRNLADLEDEDLPALVVADGDEEAEETDAGGSKLPALRPRIMVMAPAIAAVLIGKPEDLGPLASELRARLIDAVANDATLQGLCLNKRMSYEGCKTQALKGGRGAMLAMSLMFTFTYVFRPQDLGPGSA
jgi:hypothetical protein